MPGGRGHLIRAECTPLTERAERLSRPTSFTNKIQSQIKSLALLGLTDSQIAKGIGIDTKTINNFKADFPEFFQSLKSWKDLADKNVEVALYKRACGYSCKETKFATAAGIITDEKEYIKHYPPDTTAGIFWLKNRQPDVWRDDSNIIIPTNIKGISIEFIDDKPEGLKQANALELSEQVRELPPPEKG